MDLRDDAVFDVLLRVCCSRAVALAHAAPPCGEYTRAKLLPNGPRALRTPAALDGRPGLSPAQALRVQESHLLFTRCVQALFVVFASGGQVSLEQPTNSMAWLEPIATHFLKEIQADLVHIAACSVGLDMHKSWIFATCYRPLQALAAICTHARGSHEDIIYRGTRDSAGGFRSRASAEYPQELAAKYAAQASGLFPRLSFQWSRVCRIHLCQCKKGRGFSRCPTGAFPPQTPRMCLLPCAPGFWTSCCSISIPHAFGIYVTLTQKLRCLHKTRFWPCNRFLSNGWPQSTHRVRSRGTWLPDNHTVWMPCSCCRPCVQTEIPLFSPAFRRVCPLALTQTYPSAEAEPDTLHDLVQEELDKGWLFELDSLASAQQRFGDKLAIGKMSIVHAAGKKPRLVVDSTVCGTNPACVIPETFGLPSVDDVRESFPLRLHSGRLSGSALDVKSAHKTVRVRPSDQGLLGITLPAADGSGPRYLFYQVCPFGANFSALWFQRLGSFFIRVLRLWIWLRHALFGYVDDFLLLQDDEVIALFAALMLAFCAMFGIPVSHSKLQLGRGIVWIGWHFGFGSGTFSVPLDKYAKLKRLLQEALASRHVHRRTMDKILGLLQWLCKLYRSFKPWLQPLYADANRALATNHSIAPGDWPGLALFLNDSLTFTSTPPGASITRLVNGIWPRFPPLSVSG